MMRQYTSAGAVVVTADVTNPRALLLDQVRATGERQTVAPKGRIELSEAPLAAALREVTEEAGLVDLTYVGYLGQEAYRFTDNDRTPAAKTVDWFVLASSDTSTNVSQAEGFTTARWLNLDRAAQATTHPAFVTYLRRAADLLAWRQATPLPFSTILDRVIRDIATGAHAVLDGHPGVGIAVCGSAARGDFVDGWSDIDFIGYGLAADAPQVQVLTRLIRKTSDRHGVPTSLHLADDHGQDARHAGPLYDMKLQAVLRRVGIDVAVIAGSAPSTIPAIPERGQLLDGLTALHDFATERLARPVTSLAARTDRARRVLSVACSAARTIVANLDPTTDLRLPAVADLLHRHHPTALIGPLLCEYDSFRRDGARELYRAEQLARRAPTAIGDLIQLTGASTAGQSPVAGG